MSFLTNVRFICPRTTHCTKTLGQLYIRFFLVYSFFFWHTTTRCTQHLHELYEYVSLDIKIHTAHKALLSYIYIYIYMCVWYLCIYMYIIVYIYIYIVVIYKEFVHVYHGTYTHILWYIHIVLIHNEYYDIHVCAHTYSGNHNIYHNTFIL